MTKNKLAVFDIDGTLTESVNIHQAAFRGALKLNGIAAFDDNWGNYKHHTDSYIFSAIYEAAHKQAAEDKHVRMFEASLYALVAEANTATPIKEIKGAANMVRHLIDNTEYHVVFATGSFHRAALLKLQQSDVYHIDELVIASDEIHSRDELVSTAITKAKEYYGTPHFDRIISFGDGYWDYKTACNLGLNFIGLANAKLSDHGVQHVFPHFEDSGLLAIL